MLGVFESDDLAHHWRTSADDEAQPIALYCIQALKHGMPPAGGLGIENDQLVVVTGGWSLRDSISFPRDRPET